MMRVLVTGGTGHVGQFIVEGLLANGHEVVVAGRTAPAGEVFSRPVSFRPLDLDPSAAHESLLDGIDHVVHAAFDHLPGRYRGGEGNDPDRFRRLNEAGSIALFKSAKAAGVARLVFLSSRAVYGVHPPGTPLDETMECRPDTLYGEVKLAAEQALSALTSPDFVGSSLRVTGVYGQYRPGAWHKWRDLFADWRAGRPIAPRVGTEVHGRDVAAAVTLMLNAGSAAVSGRVFNVSDIVVDRHDLLALAEETSVALHGRADETAVNAMTTDRLKALGWRPGGPPLLQESVRAMIEG
jgi:nucleoside-diphosphate-sugar epimerase